MKCKKCDSEKFMFIVGSTNEKPINNNLWFLCKECTWEQDTNIEAKKVIK